MMFVVDNDCLFVGGGSEEVDVDDDQDEGVVDDVVDDVVVEDVVEDMVVEEVEEEDEAEEEEIERIRLFCAIANFIARYFGCAVSSFDICARSGLEVCWRGGETVSLHRYPRHPPLLYRKIHESRRLSVEEHVDVTSAPDPRSIDLRMYWVYW